MEISGEITGVAFALGLIADVAHAEGMEMSTELLVDGLNRIFPLDEPDQEKAQQVGRPFSFADISRRYPEFLIGSAIF